MLALVCLGAGFGIAQPCPRTVFYIQGDENSSPPKGFRPAPASVPRAVVRCRFAKLYRPKPSQLSAGWSGHSPHRPPMMGGVRALALGLPPRSHRWTCCCKRTFLRIGHCPIHRLHGRVADQTAARVKHSLLFVSFKPLTSLIVFLGYPEA